MFAFFFVLIGLLQKNRTFVTSGLVICIIAALCAVAAYWSGDAASDIIDQSPPIAGVEKTMIEPHQDASGWFLGAASITGVLAIVELVVSRKRGERPRWLEVVVLLLILFSLTTVVRTALLGGRIHHPEVRAITG